MSEATFVDVDDVLGRAREAMEHVPLGNSAFQNVELADDAVTPERRVRYVLLQLHQKLVSLKSCHFRRHRLDIDIREAKDRLRDANGYVAERLAIDIGEKEWGLEMEGKLIRDTELEIRTFLAMLEKLPRVESREQFERAELTHWRGKFIGAAEAEMLAMGTVSVQTLEALKKVGVLVNRDDQGRVFLATSTQALIE